LPFAASAALAPDGKSLFLGAGNSGKYLNTVQIFTLEGEKRTKRWGPKLESASAPVCFSPDGSALTCGRAWWDLTGAAPQERDPPKELKQAVICGFSPLGLFLYDWESGLWEWNGQKARHIPGAFGAMRGHQPVITPDGRTLALRAWGPGGQPQLDIWDL